MAEGLTSEEVKEAIKLCNDAIKELSNLGKDELNIVDDLKSEATELQKNWNTKNGYSTMIQLDKVLDSLKNDLEELKSALGKISNDKLTFRKTSHIEYKNLF